MPGPKSLLTTIPLLAALLLPAGADAAELGHWRVQATASITYDWTLSSSQPCAEVGSGRVAATVTGARSKRFKMGYFARGGFKHWAIYPGVVKPTGGTISMTDGTHLNPPEESFETCTPTNKSGCVSRPIDRKRTFLDVRGKNARRRVGATFDINGLKSAFESLERTCNDGGFSDFSSFVGLPRDEDYGAVLLTMPRASSIRRKAFSVSRTQVSTGSASGTSARTVRKVTLRFTPA